MSTPATNKGEAILGILAALFLTVATTLLGFLLGGFLASRVFTSGSSMGWDRLAEALGGMLIGSIAGLILGVVLSVKLSPRKRWIAGLIAVASVVAAAALYALFPNPMQRSSHLTFETPRQNRVCSIAASFPAAESDLLDRGQFSRGPRPVTRVFSAAGLLLSAE